MHLRSAFQMFRPYAFIPRSLNVIQDDLFFFRETLLSKRKYYQNKILHLIHVCECRKWLTVQALAWTAPGNDFLLSRLSRAQVDPVI
jgi:hypothetical protein